MGYDFRIFAVERVREYGYSPVVAEIDLKKIGSGALYALHVDSTPAKPKAYVYGLDGNTKFSEDMYGKPLSIMEVGAVIKAIEADNKRESYRRFDLALAMLREFQKHFGEDARVLGYGH